MRSPLRRVAAALLLAAPVLFCTACQGTRLNLPPVMPPDFAFGMSAKEVPEPPVDYLLRVDRSGRSVYDITVRAPRRVQKDGTFDLTDAQVRELYDAVLAAEFDQLSDEYIAESGAEGRDIGIRSYWVFADGQEKRVESKYAEAPELARLRQALNTLLPKGLFSSDSTGPRELPETFVGAKGEGHFHRPGCERLKGVPKGAQESFPSHHEALNFGYDPCAVCMPMPTDNR